MTPGTVRNIEEVVCFFHQKKRIQRVTGCVLLPIKIYTHLVNRQTRKTSCVGKNISSSMPIKEQKETAYDIIFRYAYIYHDAGPGI